MIDLCTTTCNNEDKTVFRVSKMLDSGESQKEVIRQILTGPYDRFPGRHHLLDTGFILLREADQRFKIIDP